MRPPLVVIPARGGSKRLPRKNARPLLGVPLICYTIRAAQAATRAGRIVVSTDDEEIGDIARQAGADVLRRPAQLALDESPIDDVLTHAADAHAATEGSRPDIVVWLQADVPLRQPGTIDRAIRILQDEPNTSGVATGYRVTQQPAWMKTIDGNGFLRPLDPDASQFRMQDLPALYLLDGAVVAMRSTCLFAVGDPRVHRYLGPCARLLLHEHAMNSLNVDTVEDLELAELYLTKFPRFRIGGGR
jgi:CMP-N,N'-diacetyllegionaminic acid synthase